MNNPKEMSKRQTRREQMRRKEKRTRLIGIGLISIIGKSKGKRSSLKALAVESMEYFGP